MPKISKEKMVKDEQKVLEFLQSNAKDITDGLAKNAGFLDKKCGGKSRNLRKRKQFGVTPLLLMTIALG